jgi:hypothetical protein
MAGEADQTLHATGKGVADNTKTTSGAESDVQRLLPLPMAPSRR